MIEADDKLDTCSIAHTSERIGPKAKACRYMDRHLADLRRHELPPNEVGVSSLELGTLLMSSIKKFEGKIPARPMMPDEARREISEMYAKAAVDFIEKVRGWDLADPKEFAHAIAGLPRPSAA